MRRGGRQGRGERARVERRVREILGTADVGTAAADAAVPARDVWREPPPSGLRADLRADVPAGLATDLATDLAAPHPPATPLAGEPLRPTRHRAPGLVTRVLSRALARSPVRLDPSRSTAIALAVVIAVVALVVGAWVLSARPKAVPVSGPAVSPRTPSASSATALPIGSRPVPGGRSALTKAGSPGSLPSASPSSGSGAPLIVDVAGRVRRPGLYRLPAGARVDDAVRAAGGALPGVDLATLNLAAALVDGEQVAVGIAPAPDVPPSAARSRGSATATGPVHLNSATADQLQMLPGVGPVLAQHILDFRTAHGSFTSVDQLNDVPGIGDSKFAELRASVVL